MLLWLCAYGDSAEVTYHTLNLNAKVQSALPLSVLRKHLEYNIHPTYHQVIKDLRLFQKRQSDQDEPGSSEKICGVSLQLSPLNAYSMIALNQSFFVTVNQTTLKKFIFIVQEKRFKALPDCRVLGW